MARFKFIAWLVDFLHSNEFQVFDWDEGNSTKSEHKHGITIEDIESAFQDDRPLVLGEQYSPVPAEGESRYGIVARASSGEILFICFTLRNGMIRPISARSANKKERGLYEQ